MTKQRLQDAGPRLVNQRRRLRVEFLSALQSLLVRVQVGERDDEGA